MITFEEIIEAIHNGIADNDLSKINTAIAQRFELINSKKTLFLSPGDQVKFNDTANPRYLAGKTVVVKKVNRTTVSVDMPDEFEFRRYRGAKDVRCPISIIDKVEA